MRRLLAYLIAMFAFMACASQLENDFPGGMDPSLEGKPVTITFSVPDVRLSSLTKGVDGEDGGISLYVVALRASSISEKPKLNLTPSLIYLSRKRFL